MKFSIISNKLIRHGLKIKSKYRDKFLNCIRRVARKFCEFHPYIIIKKITIHTWFDTFTYLTQNGLLAVYTFKSGLVNKHK